MSGFLKRLISGLIIGVAGIVPGLSGGVIAAALGFYEPAILALTGFIKRPRPNAFFLLPLIIGAGAGMLLFSNVVSRLMETASDEVLFLFFGLVVGSLPSVLKEANAQGFRFRYIWATVMALIAVLAVDFMGSFVASADNNAVWDMGHGIFYGMILALGTIVPGISSSFLLIYFGAYQGYLNAIASVDFEVLGPIALGFMIAAAPLIKLVEIFFRRYHGFSYYAVLGFLLGSMLIIFPCPAGGWQMLADMLLLCSGIVASLLLLKLNRY